MGAFEIKGDKDKFDFNLDPKDAPNDIPEDQRKLSHGIYGTAGVLRLLEQQKLFAKDQRSLKEFQTRILQAAEVGLERNHVKPRLATAALTQIRRDIVLRKGQAIKMRYLSKLGLYALGGIAIGAGVIQLAQQGIPRVTVSLPSLVGYGWVVIGAMAGGWMSVASTRRDVAFEDMPNFLDSHLEPLIRLIFVALLAVILGLFLQRELMTINIAGVKFAEFAGNAGTAILLGVLAGFSEKAISTRIIKRVSQVISPSVP